VTAWLDLTAKPSTSFSTRAVWIAAPLWTAMHQRMS